MDKRQTTHPETKETDREVRPDDRSKTGSSGPAAGPQDGDKAEDVTEEVMSSSGSSRKQRKRKRQQDDELIRIHGLSVDRYREVYHSVLQPSVLSALSSASPADYMVQVLELKQRLWTALSRPRLLETVGEDGRVEVTELLDLT